jgi:hypothetical protein
MRLLIAILTFAPATLGLLGTQAWAQGSREQPQWEPEAIRRAAQSDIRNLTKFSTGIPNGLTHLVTTPTAQKYPYLWSYFMAGAEVWNTDDQACFYNPFVDAFLLVRLGPGGITRIEVGIGSQDAANQSGLPAWLQTQRPPGEALLALTAKVKENWTKLPTSWAHLPAIEARLLGGYSSVPMLLDLQPTFGRTLKTFVPAFQQGKGDALLRMGVKTPDLPPAWKAGCAPYYAILGEQVSLVFFVNRMETGRFIALVLGNDGRAALEVFHPAGLD